MKQFDLDTWLQDKSRKVITRQGKPVRIICTDRRLTDSWPIVALEDYGDGEFVIYANVDGRTDMCAENSHDLFFADEEEELTEFEKELQIIISNASYWTSDNGSISTYCQFGDKEIKKISGQILDLARKEIQPEFDKEMDKMLAETDKVVYQKGREDALKSLPKLEKTKDCIDPTIPIMYTNTPSMKSYIEYHGYNLCINDVFEKLPKEE